MVRVGKMAGGICLVLLGVLPVLLYGYTSVREQRQKIREAVEKLATQICETGICDYENILETEGRLAVLAAGELRLEEYQREEEAGGTVHWYLVSWEELEHRLKQENTIRFCEGTAIRVTYSFVRGSRCQGLLPGGGESVIYGGRIF